MSRTIWAALIGVALVIGGSYVVLTSKNSAADDSLQLNESVTTPDKDAAAGSDPTNNQTSEAPSQVTDKPSQSDDKAAGNGQASSHEASGSKGNEGSKDTSQVTVSDPKSVAVLVNKTHRLPEGYEPDDLVYPDVAFIFSEQSDKRKMRREAADALKELFDAASKDGIELAGVSGYRSESRQRTLFDNYVKRDGLEAASRYSAKPGFSEHQTGLAMDVSGKDGKCAAEDCFADTNEAKWLADHAHEYGFIIRYPQNKEDVTGYKYEAWHLRYVGVDLAELIHAGGLTLEEYSEQHAA
jgi:D-alanyl-D-alanine carboxypeptidase